MSTTDPHHPVTALHRLDAAASAPSAAAPARAFPADCESHPATFGRATQADLPRPTAELRRLIPDVFQGFSELHDAALAPGALDARTKELIALAIAVSKECDGCIAAHARAAARAGATAAEVTETLGVVILMNGPATVFRPRAVGAFADNP